MSVDRERDVKIHALRRATRFPDSEHGVAAATQPVEGNSSFLENLREFEAERLAVKLHGTLEIANGEVRFEEAADGDHGSFDWMRADGGGSKAGFWVLATGF